MISYDKKQRVSLFDIKDKIRVNGRCGYDEKNGIRVAWPYSGIEFSGWFDADVKLYFNHTAEESVDFYVAVDGDYANAENISLPSELSCVTLANFERGYHSIGLYKVTGAQKDNVWLSFIEYSGELDTEPLPKSLKLEIIGDSISCGTGLISPNYDNDAYYSYGAMLARDLNAELSIVAVPGWGIACGVSNFDNVVPRIYDRTCYFTDEKQLWDFENRQVDAVILNLGTNDWLQYAHNDDRSELHAALRKFLDTIRNCYPNASVYMTYGMMNDAFEEDFKRIIAERNDAKMTIFRSSYNGKGVGGHPCAEAHVGYANKFKEILCGDLALTVQSDTVAAYVKEKNDTKGGAR